MTKKVTVHLPTELLSKAQKSVNAGVTETIRRGLELVAAQEAYGQLRAMRGKIKFSVDLSRLRDDRT